MPLAWASVCGGVLCGPVLNAVLPPTGRAAAGSSAVARGGAAGSVVGGTAAGRWDCYRRGGIFHVTHSLCKSFVGAGEDGAERAEFCAGFRPPIRGC